MKEMENSISEVTIRKTCRVCEGTILKDVMDFGVPYISDFPRRKAPRHPPVGLKVVRCANCGLVQLKDTAPREWMYREYFYRSGLNESMVKALADVVEKASAIAKLRNADTVMDIGANDGTLLAQYMDTNYLDIDCPGRIAFEPALNLRDELFQHCEIMIADFFPPETRYDGPKAKIITSIAMFYDLEEPKKFVEEIARVLHPEGVWVCQFTDLLAMIEANAWDSFCHEHLCYYSFSVFHALVKLYGLEILDVERNDVNGGSVRYYVVHRDSQVKAPEGAYNRIVQEIADDAMLTDMVLECWKVAIEENKKKVLEYIAAVRHGGVGVVDVLGASTKGNTLLQYFGLTAVDIRRAVDRNADKDGRFCVGSWIPVVGEKEGREWPADVYLVLPWHFRDNLVKREEKFLAAGGRLLFPMPKPVVVSKDGEVEL